MQKWNGLDIVKIFSITWICLYHLLDARYNWILGKIFDTGNIFLFFQQNTENFSSFIKSFLAFGVMGVNLFVIASGFGLTFSTLKNPNFSPCLFFKKRFFRLAIPYWTILFLLLCLVIFSGNPVPWTDFFLHTFFLHTFFPQFTMSLSAPWWFLGLIVQLYLLFPLLLFFLKKISPWWFLALSLIASFLLSKIFYSFFEEGRFFPEFLFDFCLGITLAFFAIQSPETLKKENKKQAMIAFFCAIITWGILLFLGKNIHDFSLFTHFLLYHATASALFLSIFFTGNFTLNTCRIIPFMGNLSFSVFLTHHLFLTTIFQPHCFSLSFPIAALLFLVLSFVLAFCYDFFLQQLEKQTKKLFSFFSLL